MNRLYLLGFTHDLKGVVFGQRKGAKKATLWVPVDDSFLNAIDKLEDARAEKEAAKGKGKKGKAKPAGRKRRSPQQPERRVILPPVGRSQSSSQIPASEIQQLLREGRTVKAVVEASKAPQAWVERLFEPVLIERGGVIRLAQRATMSRPRLGRSGLPVGEAVLRNLEERRATADTIEGLDDAWDARASHTGSWRVWVRFGHRGKRRTAEWNFNKSTREVTPRNRLGAQLGWWPPEAVAAPPIEDLESVDGEGAEEEASGPKPRKRARRRSPKRKPARRPAAKRRPAKRGPARKAARRPRKSATRRRR